jgi:hypothetical protein
MASERARRISDEHYRSAGHCDHANPCDCAERALADLIDRELAELVGAADIASQHDHLSSGLLQRALAGWRTGK